MVQNAILSFQDTQINPGIGTNTRFGLPACTHEVLADTTAAIPVVYVDE